MIPYWPQPVWAAGPLTLHAFGLLQAVALLGGYVWVLRRATKAGLDERRTGTLFVAGIVAGLAAGFLAHRGPGESAAGLTAGTLGVALVAWMRWGASVLPHLDTLASVAPVVGGVARFGCFLAHDHRGRASSGMFAVRFPEGPRIDLGLVECVAAFAIAGPVWWLWRSRPAPGVVAGVVAAAAIAMRVVMSRLLV